MTNLDSILKSRDITLSTKGHLLKAMGVPVVMYECESWTIKKVEHRRIDAFELWFWRRLLRVPWTARTQPSRLLCLWKFQARILEWAAMSFFTYHILNSIASWEFKMEARGLPRWSSG